MANLTYPLMRSLPQVVFTAAFLKYPTPAVACSGYPGRYYTVLRNTPVIPEFFGVKIESVVDKNGSLKQV